MAVVQKKKMSLGTQGLIGLAAGLAAGAGIAARKSPALIQGGEAIELAGKVWINAILMTIVPLVVSKLIVSIAGSDDAGALGRAGRKAAMLFVVLLLVSAAATAAFMPMVFSRLPIDAAASAALRAGITEKAPAPVSASQWILGLVPTNAIRSAADGAMVPLVLFTIAFGLGITRIADEQRRMLVQFFRAIDAAISVLLGWIVALSPYGVFALGVGLAMKVGAGIVTALGYYVVVSSLTLVVFTLALYAVVGAGGTSPKRFGEAAGPAQLVALSTHSSAASFPAMLQGAERLGLSKTASGFVMPLALAVFKYSSPIWFVVVTFFIGRLYDIAVDPSRIVPVVLMAVVTSFAVGGVPSGAAVMVAPVLIAAGLPVEAMALLLAVDPIPNAFRTVANVTGMLAVATLTGRRDENEETESPRPPHELFRTEEAK